MLLCSLPCMHHASYSTSEACLFCLVYAQSSSRAMYVQPLLHVFTHPDIAPNVVCCWCLQGPAPSVYQEQQLQQQQQQLQHHQQQQQRSGDTEALQLNVSMSPHHVTPIAEPMNAPSLPVSQDPAGTNWNIAAIPACMHKLPHPAVLYAPVSVIILQIRLAGNSTSTTTCIMPVEQTAACPSHALHLILVV